MAIIILFLARLSGEVAKISDKAHDQKWLKRSLVGFLLLALVILVVTFCGLVNTHGGLHVAAILVLSVGTAYMVAEAGGCFSKYHRHQRQ